MESVSAIIVTRGDVDVAPIVKGLPQDWEVLVWDNGAKMLMSRGYDTYQEASDLSVYGRYAAIEHASNDLIYVQDDDCVVSDPQALVREWLARRAGFAAMSIFPCNTHVVCNMPPEFRHDFYRDHALVGFGACFHRDAPARAWMKMAESGSQEFIRPDNGFFYRTCDIVFTGLSPRVLVDVPKTNLWWAEDETRMYRQPEHVAERHRMLELVRKVRDAG